MLKMMPFRTSAVAFVVLATLACGGRTVSITPRAPLSASELAELRVDPGTTPRDLFWGVGGKEHAPAPEAIYDFEAKDTKGFSVSFDVIGPGQIGWSAKIGDEAQTEVVLSRILWGLGYHQPPVYYLPSWQLRNDGETERQSEARFRPKLADLQRLEAVWSWADNPFSGTRELKGLLVVMLMLNSTDLKDSNNSIYQSSRMWDGAQRWFVVRDIGAALGETGIMFPKRNWLEGFEKRAFLTAVRADAVEFDYRGRWKELLTMIGPADVQWASREMTRLTDTQWQDAFRAANYSPPDAARYITRIKEKIDDGLALRVDRRVVAREDR